MKDPINNSGLRCDTCETKRLSVKKREPFKGENYRRGFLAGHKAGAEESRQYILNTPEGDAESVIIR